MFKKLKSNQYITEYLWDDVKGLATVAILGVVIGGAVTLLIFHPYILT